MKRTHTPSLASAATILLSALAATPALAQEPPCQAQLEQRYSDASADLSLILERLPEDKRGPVLGWADCEAPHYNLGRVTEEAVRALDQSRRTEDSVTLFLSAAQTLQVTNPRGAFPRSELVPHISSRPGRSVLESRLQPPLGDLSWAATLADLNAETHSMQAWASLSRAGLLKEGAAAKARDELAGSLLMAATWLDYAQRERPPVFTALANDAAAVDAFGLLWTRAEAALEASKGLGLGTHDAEILKAAYAKLPAVKELFVRAGRQAPRFNTALASAPEPKKDAAAPTDDDKANEAEAGAKKANKDDGEANEDEAANKAGGDGEPAAAQVRDETKKADEAKKADAKEGDSEEAQVKGDQGDDEKAADDGEDSEDAAAKKEDAKSGDEDAAEELMPWEGTAGKVRMGALGLGLLFPWILLLILFLRKRRERPYVQLANRFVTFTTVLMIVETIVVLMVSFMSSLDVFWSIDGGFLLVPPYAFVVLLLMFRKLDPDGKITARRVVRNWAIGGTITLGLLVVANIIVPFAVPQAMGVFALPITFVIIGLMACGFLLHLWMVSSRGEEGAEEGGEQAPPAEEAAAKPDAPPAPDEAPAAPRPTPPRPAPVEQAPGASPAPAQPDAVSDEALESGFAELEGSPEKDASSDYEMSDDDFFAGLAALEAGEDDGGGDAPDDDRAELYKLLGK